MSLKYKVTKYIVDGDDASKTKIGIKVTDENNNDFFIDTSVTTGSKTSATLMKAAHTAIASEVTAWQNKQENIGKVWNDVSKSFE